MQTKEDIFDKYYVYDGKTPTKDRMLNAMQEFADQETASFIEELDLKKKELKTLQSYYSKKEGLLNKEIGDLSLVVKKTEEERDGYIKQLWAFSRLVKKQAELIELKSKFFNRFMVKKVVELELGISDIKDSLDQKWLK